MRISGNRILVVGLILGVAACLLSPFPAAAGSPSFTLWTDGSTGWSSTNTTFTNPGPSLDVYVGDNVTLVLNSTDGSNHAWFIDYDNNTNRNAGEPQSPTFQDVALSWNFTATRNGTFLYRDRFNPDLVGQITIRVGSPPPAGVDASVAIAIGAVIAFVAVIALLYFLTQKKPQQRPEKK